jgi:hypothetical protein
VESECAAADEEGRNKEGEDREWMVLFFFLTNKTNTTRKKK